MNKNDRHEILFYEPHAAAQSLQNFWTRMASTYGCIEVVLSRERLVIQPHWFATGLIRLLGLDLHHEISIANIKKVTERGKWYRYGKIEVEFDSKDGKTNQIWLYLKKDREFVDLVKAAMYRYGREK